MIIISDQNIGYMQSLNNGRIFLTLIWVIPNANSKANVSKAYPYLD